MGTVSSVGRNGATKVFKHGEKAYSHHFLADCPWVSEGRLIFAVKKQAGRAQGSVTGRSQPGWEKRGDESFDEDPLNNKTMWEPIFGRRFTRRV